MAGAQRALGYWTCFAFAFGLTGKTSALSADSSYDQIMQACAQCDTLFANAAAFSPNISDALSTALDDAKLYCRNLDNVSQCYANCKVGSNYTYSSSRMKHFEDFYRDYCDPTCYSMVVTYCFRRVVFSTSCNGTAMNTELRECLKVELFEKQKCLAACTHGQRNALYWFTVLHVPCLISYTTQKSCYRSVQYCSEKYLGVAAVDYIGLTDPMLVDSNGARCKYFGTDYISCLETTLNGTVVFNNGTTNVTYTSPCHGSETQITYFAQLVERYLAAPFCSARNTTLEAVCHASGNTTTEYITSAANNTARSTSTTITTTEKTATATLTAFGTTAAANGLQINQSTKRIPQSQAATTANKVFEKLQVKEWLSFTSSALSWPQVTRSSVIVFVPAGVLLIRRFIL